jgi:hypothetical protein
MKCPNCGTENPEGALYCGECGTKLPLEETAPSEGKEEEKPEEETAAPAVEAAQTASEETAESQEKEPALSVMQLHPYSEVQEEEPAPQPEETPAPMPAPAVEPEEKEEPEEAMEPVIPEAVSEPAPKTKKEVQKEEIKALPRKYRPISMVTYFIDLLVLSFLPYVVGMILNHFYSAQAEGIWANLLPVSGPLLHALVLLFCSFVPRNLNLRNFARAWFLFLLLVIVFLAVTGNLETVIQFLSQFTFS